MRNRLGWYVVWVSNLSMRCIMHLKELQHHRTIVHVLPHGCYLQNHQVICVIWDLCPIKCDPCDSETGACTTFGRWCGHASYTVPVSSLLPSKGNIEISSDSTLPHVTSCHPTKLIRTPNIGWILDDLSKFLAGVGMLMESDLGTFDFCVVLDAQAKAARKFIYENIFV